MLWTDKNGLLVFYEAGEAITMENDQWNYYCILIHGSVTAYKKKTKLGTLAPGHWFGSMKQTKAPASMITDTDCLLLMFTEMDAQYHIRKPL